jgi:hypothetical protein
LIVISGVLALVALALLIAGLASTGLTLVYISIAISLVSAVFLGIGAYQRRGEEIATPQPTPEPSYAGGDEVTRVVTPVAAPAEAAVRFAEPVGADVDADGGPTVLVVPGRPRYHVTGCRYLVGKEVERRSVAAARNEGYTACGICRPDENLPAAGAPEPAAADYAEFAPVGGGEAGDTEPASPVGRSAATRKSAAKKTATKATAKKTTAKTAAKKTAAKKTTAKTAATKTAAKKTSAAGKKTAAGSATVVVIPDRDKFHTADCRFVKGVRGTARLPKTEARQQGYQACGVCKP